jgi:hypothetical protein
LRSFCQLSEALSRNSIAFFEENDLLLASSGELAPGSIGSAEKIEEKAHTKDMIARKCFIRGSFQRREKQTAGMHRN